MKITIDKKMTYVSEVPAVKARIKEFKAKYEDWQILKAFTDAVKDESNLALQLDIFTDTIITCDLSAYSAVNENHYYVEMTVRNIRGFYDLTFFIDDNLKVSTGELLWTIELFQRTEKQAA